MTQVQGTGAAFINNALHTEHIADPRSARIQREECARVFECMQNEDEILDAKEVGVVVKLHERSIRRMSERGELPGVRIGFTLRCSKGCPA